MLLHVIVRDCHSQRAPRRNIYAEQFLGAATKRIHADDNSVQLSATGDPDVAFSNRVCMQCPADRLPCAASDYKFADMRIKSSICFWTAAMQARVDNVSAERFLDAVATRIQEHFSSLKFLLR